jgi:hypothetical protein
MYRRSAGLGSWRACPVLPSLAFTVISAPFRRTLRQIYTLSLALARGDFRFHHPGRTHMRASGWSDTWDRAACRENAMRVATFFNLGRARATRKAPGFL